MSPNKSNGPVPMTWRRAAPILIVSAIFDLLRLFFELFWLLGPAVAALYCTNTINTSVGSAVGETVGTVVAGGCTAVATGVGIAFSGGITMFGIVMAMVIGFAGWLTVSTALLMFNPRIFKANAIASWWLLLGLGVSQVPFLGSLPALTATTAKLYHTQIKKEAQTPPAG